MKRTQPLLPRGDAARRHHSGLNPVAAACAVTLGLCASAVLAQDAPPAPAPAASAAADSQVLDTVVVSGIRQSMTSSLNLKRETHGLVDGIVAEDIGKFPDTNLAESMQRIAGVSIDRNSSGEGSKITVRGVGPDFNMILLNGRQMPTGVISGGTGGANGSRAFDFANLSSDSISAIEVYKTARSSSPTGGIGATVNVRTARPLDLRNRVASIGIKADYEGSNARVPEANQGSKVTPEISGIYSDTFADHTFGIAISGSYSKRDSGFNQASTGAGWHTFAAGSGDWGSIPAKPATGVDPITNRPTGLYSTALDIRYSLAAVQRERLNGQMTLQWAPRKDLKVTLDHTMATNTINKKANDLNSWFNFSFGPSTFTSAPVATPIIQTASYPNNDHDLAIEAGIYAEKSKLASTGFNMEWKTNEDLKFELDAHHSTSRTRPNSPYGTYSLLDLGMYAQGDAVAYYDQKLPLFNLPNTVFNAQKLQQAGSQFITNLADQTVDQVQLSSTYKLNVDDKLNVGLGFTKVKNRAASGNNQNNDWSGNGAPGDFAGVPITTASLGGFFSRVPGHDDPRLYSTMYLFDFDALRARAIQIAMTKGTVTHPAPLTQAEAEAYFRAAPDYSQGNDWRTNEKSSSAYVQWDHYFDTSIPMNLSAGLRYESTTVDSASQVVTRTGSSWDAGNEISLTTGPATFGTASGKYSYVLPSIDWDADLTSEVKVRASYGENIGRPGWDTLLGGVNIGSLANAGGISGSTGNPGLKPLKAKNLDFSAEWYYAKASYVSAGVFYKKISNFVGSSAVKTTIPGLTTPIGGAYYNAGLAACGGNTQPECIRKYIFNTYGGQPGVTVTGMNAAGEVQGKIAGLPTDPLMPALITTPANEAGDSIKGLELNAQHMFGNSGFGVAGNFTWVRTGLKYDDTSLATQSALVGVSNSANLVGFYEDNSWSVRAAYNWRGEFLAGKGEGPVYTEPYGQVDMSIGYKLGKSLTIQADLLNLNDGYIRQHARAKEQLVSVTQTGRRYLVGLRYRF